jgi:hypothetical protein
VTSLSFKVTHLDFRRFNFHEALKGYWSTINALFCYGRCICCNIWSSGMLRKLDCFLIIAVFGQPVGSVFKGRTVPWRWNQLVVPKRRYLAVSQHPRRADISLTSRRKPEIVDERFCETSFVLEESSSCCVVELPSSGGFCIEAFLCVHVNV